jgi:hypothetical protein
VFDSPSVCTDGTPTEPYPDVVPKQWMRDPPAAPVEGGASDEFSDEAFQHAMDDALRRAFCADWNAGPASDYRPLSEAEVLDNPGRMRWLVALQKAAWEVVERFTDPAPAAAPDEDGPERSAWAPAGDLRVGDVIERGPYKGAIVRITEHGRAIGDGSVDWRTFQVARASSLGGMDPSSTMGPLKATELVELIVRAPDEDGAREALWAWRPALADGPWQLVVGDEHGVALMRRRPDLYDVRRFVAEPASSAPVEGDGRSARETIAFELSQRGFKHYAAAQWKALAEQRQRRIDELEGAVAPSEGDGRGLDALCERLVNDDRLVELTDKALSRPTGPVNDLVRADVRAVFVALANALCFEASIEAPPASVETGDGDAREAGDDVIVQLRVRRANLPILTSDAGSPIEGAIALRQRADGVYEMEAVTDFFTGMLARAVGVDQVNAELLPPAGDGDAEAGR